MRHPSLLCPSATRAYACLSISSAAPPPPAPEFTSERFLHARQQSETRFREDLPRDVFSEPRKLTSEQLSPSPSPTTTNPHVRHERNHSTPPRSQSPFPFPDSRRTAHQRTQSTPVSHVDQDSVPIGGELYGESPRRPTLGVDAASRPRNPTPLAASSAMPDKRSPLSKNYYPSDDLRRAVRPGEAPSQSRVDRDFEELMVCIDGCCICVRC
jgi:hypothetical protein